MKRLLSAILASVILFSSFTQAVLAYNLTQQDVTLAERAASKIEKLISLKGETYRARYLRALRQLKTKYTNNERISALLEATIAIIDGDETTTVSAIMSPITNSTTTTTSPSVKSCDTNEKNPCLYGRTCVNNDWKCNPNPTPITTTTTTTTVVDMNARYDTHDATYLYFRGKPEGMYFGTITPELTEDGYKNNFVQQFIGSNSSKFSTSFREGTSHIDSIGNTPGNWQDATNDYKKAYVLKDKNLISSFVSGFKQLASCQSQKNQICYLTNGSIGTFSTDYITRFSGGFNMDWRVGTSLQKSLFQDVPVNQQYSSTYNLRSWNNKFSLAQLYNRAKTYNVYVNQDSSELIINEIDIAIAGSITPVSTAVKFDHADTTKLYFTDKVSSLYGVTITPEYTQNGLNNPIQEWINSCTNGSSCGGNYLTQVVKQDTGGTSKIHVLRDPAAISSFNAHLDNVINISNLGQSNILYRIAGWFYLSQETQNSIYLGGHFGPGASSLKSLPANTPDTFKTYRIYRNSDNSEVVIVESTINGKQYIGHFNGGSASVETGKLSINMMNDSYDKSTMYSGFMTAEYTTQGATNDTIESQFLKPYSNARIANGKVDNYNSYGSVYLFKDPVLIRNFTNQFVSGGTEFLPMGSDYSQVTSSVQNILYRGAWTTWSIEDPINKLSFRYFWSPNRSSFSMMQQNWGLPVDNTVNGAVTYKVLINQDLSEMVIMKLYLSVHE